MQWHLTIAHPDRVTLFPSEAHRLRAVQAMVRVVGARLILFFVADDHVHAWLFADRSDVGHVAGSLGQALRAVSGQELASARLRPVEARSHSENLVGYILDQSTHHELANVDHPASWEGSAFADLVSARLLPGFGPQGLIEALPRLPREAVYAAVGLEPFEPATDRRLSALGVDALAEAARSALGQAAITGNEPPRVRARAAVARLSVQLGMPRPRTAEALGVSIRAVQRGAAAPCDPALDRAIRKWVALQDACVGWRTPVSRPATKVEDRSPGGGPSSRGTTNVGDRLDGGRPSSRGATGTPGRWG